MSSALTEKHCAPCEGGTQPMDESTAKEYLEQVDSRWAVSTDGKVISAQCKFKNYYHTQAFINAVAWIAHQEDHHPDIEFGYNRARINYSTHAIDGLSENDFISAAKVDALLA
jgi:4a-hydroxytetrahydrobiopterin dehydratase